MNLAQIQALKKSVPKGDKKRKKEVRLRFCINNLYMNGISVFQHVCTIIVALYPALDIKSNVAT